jgi:hypothetical protein
MSTETVEKPRIVEAAKRAVANRTVYVRSTTTGVVPMERRLVDGSKNVSRCEYGPTGMPINQITVRPLNFGSDGIMALNPADVDDIALIKECKLWLEDATDPRIAKYEITLQEGGERRGAPIPLYEKRKPEALITAMTDHIDLIADDPEAVRDFLEACAKYELAREGDKPARPKVLNAIDELGFAAGVEYGTDVVDED